MRVEIDEMNALLGPVRSDDPARSRRRVQIRSGVHQSNFIRHQERTGQHRTRGAWPSRPAMANVRAAHRKLDVLSAVQRELRSAIVGSRRARMVDEADNAARSVNAIVGPLGSPRVSAAR